MRDEDISSIARSFSPVLSRRAGRALAVYGEPGSGKSHAVAALLKALPCRGLLLEAASGPAGLARALPRPRQLPLWAARRLDRVSEGEALEAEALAQAVCAALAGLAPFVVVLEDLPELSGERVDWVVRLAAGVLRTRGAGLVITCRAEAPPPFTSRHLEPLSEEETVALLHAESGSPLPRETTEWVSRRARGNPLFALEYLQFLRRQGFLWPDGARWRWRAPSEEVVPATVEALIEDLTLSAAGEEDVRLVLEALAVLPDADEEALRTLTGLDWARLEVARAGLERAGVTRGGRFAHPVIREVTSRQIPGTRRREVALRAIRLLGERDPESAAALAGEAALPEAETLALLDRAIEQSRLADAPARTARLLALAVERSSGRERVQYARTAIALLEGNNAHSEVARLARLALQAGPSDREVRASLAGALAWLGREDEVRSLIAELPESERAETRWVDCLFRAQAQSTRVREALETWGAHPQLAEIPRSLTMAAHAFTNLGDHRAAEELAARAFAMPDLPWRARANLTGLLAFIRSDRGELGEAQRLHDESVALSVAGGDPALIAAAHYNRSFNLYRLGRHSESLRDLEEAARNYDLAGNAQYGANARTLLGATLGGLGQFERGESVLLEAHEALTRQSVTYSLVNNEWALATLYREWRPQHGGALALKYARAAVRHARELGVERALFFALCAAARAEAWAGDPARALALANEAAPMMERAEPNDDAYNGLAALAAALEAGGRSREALDCWREATRHALTDEASHEAAFEVARLEGDQARTREVLAWFEDKGLAALALRARRALPAAPVTASPPQPEARLEVLGDFRLLRAGRPVPYRGRKRAEILAMLLEARIAGRPGVSVADLLEALYPEEAEADARRTLKQQVYLIRSSLGQDSVLSTPGGYALGAASSDAEDFLGVGGTALWRGPYLAGLSENRRGEVTGALSMALRDAVEGSLHANAREAARLGHILVQMEPYDIEGLGLTARALLASGDRAAAESLYREGRARLEEVGEELPPSLDCFLDAAPAEPEASPHARVVSKA